MFPTFLAIFYLQPRNFGDGSLCDGVCHQKGDDVVIHLLFIGLEITMILSEHRLHAKILAGHVRIIAYRV